VPAHSIVYLVLRGVKTLAVRMERHCANARAIVDLLVGHRAVERVLYPQLPDHPGHRAAAQQMRDFGGMVSFTLRDGSRRRLAGRRGHGALRAGRVARRGRKPHRASGPDDACLGGRVPLEVPDNLLRLSVGIESACRPGAPTSSKLSGRTSGIDAPAGRGLRATHHHGADDHDEHPEDRHRMEIVAADRDTPKIVPTMGVKKIPIIAA